MPLRDNSYLDSPMTFQAKNFQLPVDQSVQPQQPKSEGIGGWLERQLFRNGGLRPGRDNAQITSFAGMIASGQLPEQQVMELRQKNPDSDAIFAQAQNDNRQRQQVQQIMQQYSNNLPRMTEALRQSGNYELAQKIDVQRHQQEMERLAQERETRMALESKEPPFVKELRASGLTPGTPAWNKAMADRIKKETSPTMTTMLSQTPDKDEVNFLADMALKDPAGAKSLISYRDPLTQRAVGIRVAQLAKEQGRTGSQVATGQAEFHAQKTGMAALERQRNLILTFEKTAFKNAQLALDTSEKVDRTGSPAINRWLLSGKKSVAGDPDVAKFDLAIRTFINEYARVTNSATGGGVTSDSARKEIEDALNRSYTKEQVRAVIEQAKMEMENRASAYTQQSQELKGRMSGGQTSTTTESNVVNWDTLK